MQRCASKGRKEECLLVNMDVNNAEFKGLKIKALQMFRPQGEIHSVFW